MIAGGAVRTSREAGSVLAPIPTTEDSSSTECLTWDRREACRKAWTLFREKKYVPREELKSLMWAGGYQQRSIKDRRVGRTHDRAVEFYLVRPLRRKLPAGWQIVSVRQEGWLLRRWSHLTPTEQLIYAALKEMPSVGIRHFVPMLKLGEDSPSARSTVRSHIRNLRMKVPERIVSVKKGTLSYRLEEASESDR